MWETNEDCKVLLRKWIGETENLDLKKTINKWLKIDPLVVDTGELVKVLKSLANDFPVYKLIEKLKIHRPVVKKIIDPVYQARIQKLKWEQENAEYAKMIRFIDPSQDYGASKLMGNFGEEIKTMNRQTIAVFNTILTVGGAFSFGFFGINYAYPNLNMSIAMRMMIGLVLATIVFLADLYFIVKGMDEVNLINAKQQFPLEKFIPPMQPELSRRRDLRKNEQHVREKKTAKGKVRKTKRLD